jgi:hypothetical protein
MERPLVANVMLHGMSGMTLAKEDLVLFAEMAMLQSMYGHWTKAEADRFVELKAYFLWLRGQLLLET